MAISWPKISLVLLCFRANAEKVLKFQVSASGSLCYLPELNSSKLNPCCKVHKTIKIIHFTIRSKNQLCRVSIHPLLTILSSLFSCYSYHKDERSKPGNLQKDDSLSPTVKMECNFSHHCPSSYSLPPFFLFSVRFCVLHVLRSIISRKLQNNRVDK